MSDYLGPNDPGAFDGMEKNQPEPAARMYGQYRQPRCERREVVECGQCKGYGGWILQPNAYGPGRHFKASCNNCTGWGYVPAEQGSHVHEWDRGVEVGRCLTRYTCKTCGSVSNVDSSD